MPAIPTLADLGLTPGALRWLQYANTLAQPEQDALSNYASGVHSMGAQATTDLGTAQSELDQLTQVGAARVGPMESFGRRLAGGISQAVAPQMQGQALAEGDISSKNAAYNQRHIERLRRTEALTQRLSERAEKLGDLEASLKYQKEHVKAAQERQNLETAANISRADKQLELQRDSARMAKGNQRTSIFISQLNRGLDDAQEEYKSTLAEYTRLVNDKEGRKNKQAVQAALGRVQMAAARKRDFDQKLELAYNHITPEGILDGRAFSDGLRVFERDKRNMLVDKSTSLITSMWQEAVSRGKPIPSKTEVLRTLQAAHEKQAGYPMAPDELDILRVAYDRAYSALDSKLPEPQASGPPTRSEEPIPGGPDAVFGPGAADAIWRALTARAPMSPPTTISNPKGF